jgi:uncharacterized protein (TIGR02246 family)
MRKLLCIAATVGIALLITSPAWAADTRDNPAEEKVLQERGAALIQAFNKGDAKALSEFWSPDGDYIDEQGHRYQGRKAIEESFQKLFTAAKGAELRVHRASLRFVRPDLAIGDGLYEVVPPDGGPPTSTRYTAQRQAGRALVHRERPRDGADAAFQPGQARSAGLAHR